MNSSGTIMVPETVETQGKKSAPAVTALQFELTNTERHKSENPHPRWCSYVSIAGWAHTLANGCGLFGFLPLDEQVQICEKLSIHLSYQTLNETEKCAE